MFKGATKKEHQLTDDIMKAGFSINPDELASITSKHDMKAFKMHGGVDGISKKTRSSLRPWYIS
jgi:P-type Ca2+ transporter type 2C